MNRSIQPSQFGISLRSLLLVSALLWSGACKPPVDDDVPEEPAIPERIVAIGDLHGDLAAARAALRVAGATDEEDHWIGGKLVVVQTGDILDRGDDEAEIMELFQRLKGEAEEAGGAVYVLNGNHELMNSYLDYRYVTEGGFQEFEELAEFDPSDSLLATIEPAHRIRAAAFRPGGPIARKLAEQTVAVVVGGTVFAHAGILPEHLDMGLDQMESDIRSWLLAEAPQPEWIRGDRSPVWNRVYSRDPTMEACETLELVLERMGLDRMVVGHSVQAAGITSYCGGRVWCIDVGMAAHYGGKTEVLEIRGEVVRSLRPTTPSS